MSQQINIWVVLSILTIHFIADFVLQTDEMAKGKSKSNFHLIDHTFWYSLIWIFYIAIDRYIQDKHNLNMIVLFPLITFICHTAQDYITSRVNAKLWSEDRSHAFFVSLGFDQLLHFIQLILTYQLLT